MKKNNQYLNQPSKKTKELEGEELRESEEKYRRLFNGITDAVFVHPVTAEGKPPGKFIEVNDVACQKLGYTREELLKLSHFDITAPEELGNIPAIREKLLDKKHHLFEIVAVTKDGEKIPLEINIQQFDLNGQPVVMSIARDITEQKKMEEETKRTLSLLQSTLESTTDGILIVEKTGKIVSYNQRLVHMWGFPQNSIESRYDDKALAYVRDQLKNSQQFLNKVQELHSQPEAESFDVLELKDGRIFERFSIPLRVDGVPVGRVLSFRDVTERKKAEDALQESGNLLRTVINATREAVISIGQDGLINIFNPASEGMFGRKKEETIGKPPDCLMPGEYRERHKEYVKSYFATGEPHKAVGKILELPALRSDGKVFPMEISLSAGKYDNKQFVVAVARDITERKQAEEALKKKNEELEIFNKLAVGRELKMIELKKEINALLDELGKEPRYKIVDEL